jgi:hypothetical protein
MRWNKRYASNMYGYGGYGDAEAGFNVNAFSEKSVRMGFIR